MSASVILFFAYVKPSDYQPITAVKTAWSFYQSTGPWMDPSNTCRHGGKLLSCGFGKLKGRSERFTEHRESRWTVVQAMMRFKRQNRESLHLPSHSSKAVLDETPLGELLYHTPLRASDPSSSEQQARQEWERERER